MKHGGSRADGVKQVVEACKHTKAMPKHGSNVLTSSVLTSKFLSKRQPGVLTQEPNRKV